MRQKVSLSNKVFTENPLLDEIVYNARQIIFGGLTIKDEDAANNAETVESMKIGDIRVAIGNGTIHFSNFYYDETFLKRFYSDTDAIKYALDNKLIPVEDRSMLLNAAIEEFNENNLEYNNYYRMLNGKPYYYDSDDLEHFGYEGLWIYEPAISNTEATSLDYIYYMTPDPLNSDYKLIHELDLSKKNILYETGTCENLVNDSVKLAGWGMTKDEASYVLHIGDREVDYYKARVADRFGLLYCPACDSEEVKSRFKDLFEANRMYMLYTIYSEAYKYRSDYYDNFMMIFLTIQTVIDMIVELPEYIIRRDIFDTRTCKYIFESNGVKYFKDIPLKYQISLVKNLNRLIKFKSTDKCIVDIVSLFGTKNIEIFRYYIMKDRYVQTPQNLDYYDNKDKSSGDPDNDANYDLKFIKVPMLDEYDDYIRTESNIRDYSNLTDDDAYWAGDQAASVVKKDIKDLDFTVLRSKYYSIEAVIDLAKRNFTLTYFMNLLMYNKVDKDALKVNIPCISTTTKFDIVNIIITLYVLSYTYYGVEDTILDSRAKVAQILGFNMEADLAKIASWLKENHIGLTLKDLHVDTFRNPSQFTSYKELQEIFFTNKDCYDHIRSVMINPPSKEIYNAYRYINKALMTMNRNMECFLTDADKLEEYTEQGYKVKFVNIPKPEEYSTEEIYLQDLDWLLSTTDTKVILLDMNAEFDENHKFDMYEKVINEETGEASFSSLGKFVTMANTYMDYLDSVDDTLFTYLYKIKSISDVETRQEACVNAIQSIISSLKDYIDQEGSDAIPLEDVFAGLPSISIDFIRKYISEVIDFFKSFKIFTHDSSIIYVVNDKFDNYVQLIDHILLKYLLDKSEIIRIEDAIHKMNTDITYTERNQLIDKVWLDISTWVKKYYEEFYNSTHYTQADERIRDYQERFSTFTSDDFIFHIKKEDEEILDYHDAVDAILEMLVHLKYFDGYRKIDEEKDDTIKESINIRTNHHFNDYYNEWITDLIYLMETRIISDKMYNEKEKKRSQDNIISTSKLNKSSIYQLFDNPNNISTVIEKSDYTNISDDLSMIITNSQK